MRWGKTFWGEDDANVAWPPAWAEPLIVADVVRKVDREASIRYWFNTKELRWAFVNVANQGEPFVAMHGGSTPERSLSEW